jgi:hypothetical protein
MWMHTVETVLRVRAIFLFGLPRTRLPRASNSISALTRLVLLLLDFYRQGHSGVVRHRAFAIHTPLLLRV